MGGGGGGGKTVCEVGRVYQFEYLYIGFFGRVMGRLLGSGELKALAYWQTGFFFSSSSSISPPFIRHFLFLNSPSHQASFSPVKPPLFSSEWTSKDTKLFYTSGGWIQGWLC